MEISERYGRYVGYGAAVPADVRETIERLESEFTGSLRNEGFERRTYNEHKWYAGEFFDYILDTCMDGLANGIQPNLAAMFTVSAAITVETFVSRWCLVHRRLTGLPKLKEIVSTVKQLYIFMLNAGYVQAEDYTAVMHEIQKQQIRWKRLYMNAHYRS